MYQRSAALYDALYAFKDYAAETARLRALIQEHLRSGGRTLLDVACGTGAHLAHLRDTFRAEGLDVSAELLEIARRRLPDAPLHRADMTDFDLGRQFDVVTCLFSAIGYVQTEERLRQAVSALRRHALPGGLVIVEPWLSPDVYTTGHLGADFVDRPDLKIARMTRSEREGDVSVFDMHYLVTSAAGVEYFVERHALGLFSDAQYRSAFAAGGLEFAAYDAEGLMGRGLYIGRRPA